VKYVLRDAVKEVDATKPERLLDAVARSMATFSSGATRACMDAARTTGAIMKSFADGEMRELAIESTEVKVAFILLQRGDASSDGAESGREDVVTNLPRRPRPI
jgi:hypothetical protein